jgi:hypothetical protein
MGSPVRVMVERGKKKRSVASAFDWPGWDRSGKTEEAALAVLSAYRPRYLAVASLAGLGEEFAAAGDLSVVERVEGLGMTDFYGVSMRSAAAEYEPMSSAECSRKLALLQAAWSYLDGVAARVSGVRPGPRGGGRDRARILRHVAGAEIDEFAVKVGVATPEHVWQDPEGHRDELLAHRATLVAAIRDHHARGLPARTWALQFLIRHCAYHVLDHAWELEDRDLAAPGG